MSGSPANLEEALRGLGEDASQALQVHPGYEDLAAYSEGALPPKLTSAIDEHLAFCVDCADVVLELRQPSTVAYPAISGQKTSPTGWLQLPKTDLLIAAGLAGLAALGLWWWSRPPAHAPQAVSELAQADQPSYRDSLGAVRSDPAPIALTAGDAPSLWGLLPATEPSHRRYRVRIESAAGRTIWKESIQPVPGKPAYFYLRLDPAFFEPGRYKVEIDGRAGRKVESLGTWFLEVRTAGDSEDPGFE